ncbi:MAG: PKD domain-containing protein, partial [Bacteroidales bacterium]
MNRIKIFLIIILSIAINSSCKETEYSFDDFTSPSNLSFSTTVIGVDNENPDGDGSGKVFITCSADNKMSYNIDFGDGNSNLVYTDTFTYAYTNPGTAEYIITVKAVGIGGSIATTTSKVKVYVSFKIPTYIIEDLTDNSSKTWVADKDNAGFFGVGPGTLDAAGGKLVDLFTP